MVSKVFILILRNNHVFIKKCAFAEVVVKWELEEKTFIRFRNQRMQYMKSETCGQFLMDP